MYRKIFHKIKNFEKCATIMSFMPRWDNDNGSLFQTSWARKRATYTETFRINAQNIIKVAFSISGEQPFFLPKLNEGRYWAPLLAAAGAVHTGYFQPFLPLSHFARHFTSHFMILTIYQHFTKW